MRGNRFQKKIWNIFGFYRNKKEPKYGENGFSHAGLGLYIVQSIVTMHKGTYGVENFPTGVEFWFTLPSMGQSAS